MRSLRAAIILTACAAAWTQAGAAGAARVLKPGVARLDSTTDYLVYYGGWDADRLFRAKDFDLVILEPSAVTAPQVAELKKGHDGIAGTPDDVVVIGYISLGEDYTNNRPGNGKGPCYWSWDSSTIVFENKGVASWYLDDADRNGLPDENGAWGSYYVNAGDSAWWTFLKTSANGADHTLVTLGLDGLFLDTIDSAAPFAGWPYRWTTAGMSGLIGWLRQQYPDKILFANRGLFYFDASDSATYAHTIRPFIDADMFEAYYPNGQRSYWATRLKGEAGKADGFKVAVLDYCAPTDTAAIAAQLREVTALNWADYISSSSLGEIRYDVFHRHSVDINPPTWNSSIGAAGAFAGDRSVRLLWNRVTDQSQPVSFNVYYTAGVPFTMAAATLLQNVPAVPDTDSGTWMYMVTNLPNFTRYSFVVRAKDALGHEDQNLTVVQATPPDTSSMNMVIDGDFSDWTNVPSLNRPPNPVEQSGDAPADADITNLWAASSGSNLYLSYSVAGNVNYSSYFYHVFLDVDENAVTGFRYQDSASVGAEYMVENGGLWRYTGSGGSNWSWVPASGMALATSGGRVELSIPLTMLIAAQPVNPGVRIMLEANLAAAPYSLVDVAPSSFADSSYRFVVVTLGVRQTADALPQQIELYQNYPNPFNSTTVISYQLPAPSGAEGPVSSSVRLVVYDLLGREVATLVNETKQPGGYSVRFDAGNLASGVYCCRLTAGRASITRSMIVLK